MLPHPREFATKILDFLNKVLSKHLISGATKFEYTSLFKYVLSIYHIVSNYLILLHAEEIIE